VKIYLNGKIVDINKASISPLDRGFLCGEGLFETLRSYNSRTPFLKLHTDRLYASLKFFNIRIAEKHDDFRLVIRRLLALEKLSDAYIRITVSSGLNGAATVLVYVKKLEKLPDSFLAGGIRLSISGTARSSKSFIHAYKTTSCFENIFEREKAAKKGFANALFLDGTRKYVTECASANIFLVKNVVLSTPRLSGFPILPGITRHVVLETAKKLKIKAVEKDITLDEMNKADEVFITGSLHGIVPVRSINSRLYGKPGKTTMALMAEYSKTANNFVR